LRVAPAHQDTSTRRQIVLVTLWYGVVSLIKHRRRTDSFNNQVSFGLSLFSCAFPMCHFCIPSTYCFTTRTTVRQPSHQTTKCINSRPIADPLLVHSFRSSDVYLTSATLIRATTTSSTSILNTYSPSMSHLACSTSSFKSTESISQGAMSGESQQQI
jgi:hypothetical protein